MVCPDFLYINRYAVVKMPRCCLENATRGSCFSCGTQLLVKPSADDYDEHLQASSSGKVDKKKLRTKYFMLAKACATALQNLITAEEAGSKTEDEYKWVDKQFQDVRLTLLHLKSI